MVVVVLMFGYKLREIVMGFSPLLSAVYQVLGPWAGGCIVALLSQGLPLLYLQGTHFSSCLSFLQRTQTLSIFHLPVPSHFRRQVFAQRPQYVRGHNISQTAGLDRNLPTSTVGVKMPIHSMESPEGLERPGRAGIRPLVVEPWQACIQEGRQTDRLGHMRSSGC